MMNLPKASDAVAKAKNNIMTNESYNNIKLDIENTVTELIQQSIDKGYFGCKYRRHIDINLFKDNKINKDIIVEYALKSVIESLRNNGYEVDEPYSTYSLVCMAIKW